MWWGLASLKPIPSQLSTRRWTAENWKIAARFSTKLALFFDTILDLKFAMLGGGRLALKTSLGMPPEGVQHKIKKFQPNLAQNLQPFWSWNSQWGAEEIYLTSTSLGDISGSGTAQNLKIAAQFSTKLAQFIRNGGG